MGKENIVMTKADYVRLTGDLSLLFGAVKEMAGVIASYEGTGFISEESLNNAREYAMEALSVDGYWLRATTSIHVKMPDTKEKT
jgi:hypothetical protein